MTRFSANVFTHIAQGLTPLELTISKGAYGGRITPYVDSPTSITAPLAAIADAVESAYILTPKDELPKTERVDIQGALGRVYYFTDGGAVSTESNPTAERVRRNAARWLAIAQHLGHEEKAKAYEDAKAKAVADAATRAADAVRIRRLNELAAKYFDAKFFSDLGERKAFVIADLYRLEQKLTQEGDAA